MTTPDDPQAQRPGAPFARRVLVGISWVMLGRVAAMAALFGAQGLLGWRMDDAELSAYVLASFLVPFLSQLVNLGSTDILLRVIRKSHLESNPRLAWSGVRSCLILFAASSVVTTIGFVVLCRFLAPWRPVWALLSERAAWVAAWFILYTVTQVTSELFRGRDQFWMSSAMYSKSGGWLPNLLILVSLAAAAWTNHLDLRTVLAIHVGMTAISIAVGAVMSHRAISAASSARSEPQQDSDIPPEPDAWWLLRASWPVFVSAATLLAIEQLDIFLVSLFVGDADVADYGFAKRGLSLINFGYATLAPALMPFVAELYERGEMRRMERLVRGASTIIGLPCIALCALLFVAAEPFVTTLFGPGRTGAALPLRILLVGQVCLFLAGHANIVLIMTGRQRLLMRSTVVVGVLFAVLCPAAIVWWGVAGAAVAKSLATAERAAAAALIVRKVLGIWTTTALSPAIISDTVKLILKNGKPQRGGRGATTSANL